MLCTVHLPPPLSWFRLQCGKRTSFRIGDCEPRRPGSRAPDFIEATAEKRRRSGSSASGGSERAKRISHAAPPGHLSVMGILSPSCSDGSLGLTAKTASPARPPRTKATRIRARRRSFRASLPSRRPSRRPQPPARVLQMFRQPVPGQLSRVRDRVLDWATARAQKKDELLFHSLAQPKSSPTVEIEFRVVHQTSRHF